MRARISKVALVLDDECGEKLAALAAESHVWVVDSPANRAAASAYRAQTPAPEGGRGVTTFKASEGASDVERCLGVLGNIDLHHGQLSWNPPYSVLEVHGLPLSEVVKAAVKRLGFGHFDERADGFRAVRFTRR